MYILSIRQVPITLLQNEFVGHYAQIHAPNQKMRKRLKTGELLTGIF